MYSRRDFGKLALAGAPLAAAFATKIDSTVSGVRIGATTLVAVSYRTRPARTP